MTSTETLAGNPTRGDQNAATLHTEPTSVLKDLLSARSVQHAMGVLAEATHATAMLFDARGEAVVGPIAGDPFIETLLTCPGGRGTVMNAHRAVVDEPPAASPVGPGRVLLEAGMQYVSIPVVQDGGRIGTMTLGDRPRQVLSPEDVQTIEAAVCLSPGVLLGPAVTLPPWSEADASAARNMAALVAELFTELHEQDLDLRRRIEELSTVYNITGLLADTRDLQEVLNRATRMVCEVMKAKASSLRLLDEETGQLRVKAVHNLSDEYLQKGPVTLENNPIDEAALRGEIVHVADAASDDRTRYPEQARQEGLVSGLVCGMIYRGKVVGVLRVYTGQPHRFSPSEEALLRAVAAQAAAAIVNARLVAESIEAAQYAQQLAYAGEVQRRMIPHAPPEVRQAEIGAVYRPIFEVGGDFYDFIPLGQGNLGIAIADVVGKGAPAALMMASLRSALRVHAHHAYDIDTIFAEINQHVCRETTVGEFATAFYGVLTPDGRRLTYCNAGHDPPMLLRRGEIRFLETGGMVLGVDCTQRFDREVLALETGDVLLLYTDGAVEALNFHDEAFGRERLAESLLRYADQPAPRIVKNILWDLRRFRGYADRTDDVTLVVLKIK